MAACWEFRRGGQLWLGEPGKGAWSRKHLHRRSIIFINCLGTGILAKRIYEEIRVDA